MMPLCGVISDTHGLVRPEALEALRGVDLIVHAGDVGAQSVLDALAAIAPVHAVRGNNDVGSWARKLPETRDVRVGGARIFVIHDRKDVEDPKGFQAVVCGHSHRPGAEVRGGVIWFNPGSAGPRRFKLPVCVGRLYVEGRGVRGEIITLAP